MNEFSLIRRDVGTVSVIALNGYLDAHTAPDLEQAITELIDEERIRIVISLGELDYISSAGLGVFMGFIEDVRAKGGDIKLAEATEKVFRVFDLLGFPVLYEILDKEEEAIGKFSDEEQAHG
ncbi:STAS domain-containing protein [bacterium]|nr:STAS domain-containing protein [bacterium]